MTIRELIERQRQLARSGGILERVVGTLYLASVLGKRLAQLTDRQVGQLPAGHVAAISVTGRATYQRRLQAADRVPEVRRPRL